MKSFIKLSLVTLLLMLLGFSSQVRSMTSNFYTWLEGNFRKISFISVPDNAWTDRYFGSWLQLAPTKFFPNANCPYSVGWAGGALNIPNRAGTMPGPDNIPLNMIPFGIGVDGVLFDPSGPWYSHTQARTGHPPTPPIVTPPYKPNQASVKGFNAQNVTDDDCSGWEYEALSTFGRPNLGFDSYSGHIQPLQPQPGTAGRYHYHGYPFALVEKLMKDKPGKPTYLLGYSADGFPIYAPWNGSVGFVSGYILTPDARGRGDKTGTGKHPDGFYDGTFIQDYDYNPTAKLQFVKNVVAKGVTYHGVITPWHIQTGNYRILDHRNGIWGPTPEYPNGTYYYVITTDWPYIPRWFAAWPDDTFKQLIPPERMNLYKLACGSLHKYKNIAY